MNNVILVTGATGKTGRRLVPLLKEQGIIVRATSRHAAHHQVAFDWQDPSTHLAAIEGVHAIYLVPPAMIEDATPIIAPFVLAARTAGVRQIVLISSMGAGFPAEPPESGRRKLEALIRDSGIDWTILRPSGFMQNFSEGFLLPAVRNGAIPNPAGDGKVAMVDVADIARVAAAVLTREHHAGQIYDVTGPAPLGFMEIAEIISREADRPVAARPMTSPQFLAMLEGVGVPSDYAGMLLRDQEAVRDGAAAEIGNTVERLGGTPPRSFADYASDVADVWR